MKSEGFAYENLTEDPDWPTIEKAIDDLVRNGDLIEQTSRKHIVGYILKALGERKSKKKRGPKSR